MSDNTTVPAIEQGEYTPSKLLTSVFEWVSAAMIAIIVVAIIFSAFFRTVNVDGDSMNDTLQNGNHLLISGFLYNPNYGDIVVVRRDGDTPLIKRVIGLPGDTIYVNPEDGIVYRNDVPLNEPYIRPDSVECPTPPMTAPSKVIVQAGEIYVLGDNRGGSLDSRLLGCQPLENVVGRVILRMSPNFGKVMNGE